MNVTWIKGKLPDITPAQLIALPVVAANLLRAFGVYDTSPEQEEALTDTMQWLAVLIGADAAIRIGRNVGLGRRSTMPDEPGHPPID